MMSVSLPVTCRAGVAAMTVLMPLRGVRLESMSMPVSSVRTVVIWVVGDAVLDVRTIVLGKVYILAGSVGIQHIILK